MNDVRQLLDECVELFRIGLNQEARSYFAQRLRALLRRRICPYDTHHAPTFELLDSPHRLLLQDTQNLRHAHSGVEHLDKITAAESDSGRKSDKFSDCPFHAGTIDHERSTILVLLIECIDFWHGLFSGRCHYVQRTAGRALATPTKGYAQRTL